LTIPGLALPVAQLRDEVSEWQRRWELPVEAPEGITEEAADVANEIATEAAAAVANVSVDEESWVAIPLDEVAGTTDELQASITPADEDEDVWVLTAARNLEAKVREARETPGVPTQLAAVPVPAVREGPQTLYAPKGQGTQGDRNDANNSRKTSKAKRPKPVQDEWGFFDPDQCGFAALLAKLDEISEDDADDSHSETTVRLIAY
jgi:hypothetical protein